MKKKFRCGQVTLLAILSLAATIRADFPRQTPQADWQQQRARELMDTAARLDGRTYVWHMAAGAAADFHAINTRIEGWKVRATGPSAGKYAPGWGAVDLFMLACQCNDKLTPAARAKIIDVLEEYTGPGGYAFTETHPRRMINTNHPLNGTMALVLAGQLMNKPECIAQGRGRIRYFLDWLRDVGPEDLNESFVERRKAALEHNEDLRRGTGDIDEYNSPTYQAVSLHALAGLSNWAADREIALKARLLQEYLFLLTCARYDSAARILCGPYSRSYPLNTAGVGGNLYYILHRYLRDAPPLDVDLANRDWGPNSSDTYWIPRLAAMPYYFPDYLRGIAENKHYPYSVLVSSKSGDWGDYPYGDSKTRLDAPGGRCDLTSYLTEEYCLGSSSRYYAYAGQNENCILYWRKRSVIRPQDRKFLIFRYLIDARDPFDSVRDGLAHVYQRENRAIVLFHPAMRPRARAMRAWAGLFDGYETLDAVYVNDNLIKAGDLPRALDAGDVLFVHDGATHIAIRPLPGQNLGVKGSQVRLERQGRCLGLSMYNYEENDPLPLSLEKVPRTNPMRLIRGGFLLEVADRAHDANPADFRRRIMAQKVHEQIDDRNIRTVQWNAGDQTMAIRYDMDGDRLLARTLNGRPAAAPPLDCPDARMDYTGRVTVHNATLSGEDGLPLILAAPGESGPFIATKPTDNPGAIALATPGICWKTQKFGCGQVRLYPGQSPRIEIDCLTAGAPMLIKADGVRCVVNGDDVTARMRDASAMPGWKELAW